MRASAAPRGAKGEAVLRRVRASAAPRGTKGKGVDSPMRRGEQGPQGTAGEGVDSLTASSEGVGKAALRGAANDGVGRPTRRRHRQTREARLAARALAALRGAEGEGLRGACCLQLRVCEGTDRDAPEGVPPGGAGILGCLEAVAEKGGGWQLDLVKARHREVEGRCATAKWQVDGDNGAEKPPLHDSRCCGPGRMGPGDKNAADL